MGKHVINPEQLRLIMRPDEIMGTAVRSRDSQRGGITQSQKWAQAREEAAKPRGEGHGSGVFDSVMKEGLTSHVNLRLPEEPGGDVEMGEGAHRVVSAKMKEEATGREQWVPVQHVEHHERGWEYGPEYDRAYPQNVRPDWGPG